MRNFIQPGDSLAVAVPYAGGVSFVQGNGDHNHGAAGTGISIQNAGTGGSANMPPALIGNYALFAGV